MMQKTATTGKSAWVNGLSGLSEHTLTLVSLVIYRADTG